ncbi:MAG: endolytic transglycosylase MltG [Mariprofundaceae bacterium]|nr:endolytic transglycosylase MltG [Mariprofundaceae bacterium]
MRNGLKVLLGLSALLLFAILLFAWQQLYAKHSVSEVSLVVSSGESSYAVARDLEKKGVIDSARLFRLAARLNDKATKIKAGEYAFSGEMSIMDVLDKLVAGDVQLHHITIPEGLRTQEVLRILAEHTKSSQSDWQAVLKVVLKGEEQEGRLLPETYTYTKPIRPKEMLNSMVDAQRLILKSINPQSEKELRIMASIIEKETSLDKERPLVSAAIHNRLRLGMPLQMDPTVIYGIWKRDGVFSGNIHRQDLKSDTPWNTYTRRGLPPTPICNPGAASLRAAANPADVSYVYFVADGSGGHAFASTLEEHQANVKKWVRLERKGLQRKQSQRKHSK